MKVREKRQITLHVELCIVADIDKGDEVESFVDRQGIISIVKKSMGAASGILKGTKVNQAINDDESVESAIK